MKGVMVHRKRNPLGKSLKKTGQVTFGGSPDFLLILLVRIFLWFWFLRFNLKYDKSGLKGCKRPYILIANHPSTLDAFLIARGVNPLHTNYVASQSFFRVPILKFLLGRVGAIPKAHTQKDIQSLRLMMKALAAGRVLMVCPEGRRSLDGTGSRFTDAMAKFVKKTGLPVVAAMISGTYLAWPRWADQAHPLPLTVSFRKILEPAELSILTVSEIHERMLDALRFDEFRAGRETRNGGRNHCLAEKIERLLHLCPCCGKWEAIKGRENSIICQYCGASAIMEPEGTIRRVSGSLAQWPQVPAWYALQRDAMSEAMRDPAFLIEAGVSCLNCTTDPGKPLVPMGPGHVSLGRKGLHYLGQADGIPLDISFPISLMDTLPVSLGHFFEICDETGTYWQFRLQDERKEVQFEQYSDIHLHGEVEHDV